MQESAAIQDAERALRQSEARFRTLFENAAVGIAHLSLEGAWLGVNARAADLLGYAPDSLLRLSFEHLLQPADVESHRVQSQRLLAGEIDSYSIEQYRLRKDGSVLPLELTVSLARGDAGSPDSFICVIRDISGHGRILAILSQELRSRMAPLRTATRILSHDGVGAQQIDIVRDIVQQQMSQVTVLLDDLLDLARMAQGSLKLDLARVRLRPILDASVEAARPHIERRQHHLTVDVPAESVELEADGARLVQAIRHLLTNAARYTDPGGVIALSAASQRGWLTLAVSDNGIGLPRHVLPDVFRMLFQGEGSEPRAERGLGMGLALVKGIVDLHSGSVEARSGGPGLGCVFTIRLPLAVPRPL